MGERSLQEMEAMDAMGRTVTCDRCGNALTTYFDRAQIHGANTLQDMRCAVFLTENITGTPAVWARTICTHCDRPIWEQIDAEEAAPPFWVRVAFVLAIVAVALVLLLSRL